MSWIQYVPVVLSAGHYPTEVDVNGTSPSSAFAENAWSYTCIAQYSTTLFILS